MRPPDFPGLAAALVALLTALTLAMPSTAGELCVMCSEPAAAYRCQIEGTDAATPAGSGAQVLCIKEMATRGGHASCSVSRAQPGAACNGPLVVVARPVETPEVAAKPAADEPASGSPDPGKASLSSPAPDLPGPNPPAAEPAAKGPPSTVEQLAKDAAAQTKKDWDKTAEAVSGTTKAAGDGIKKAGDTVGSALKKSWDCVVSLFSSCRLGMAASQEKPVAANGNPARCPQLVMNRFFPRIFRAVRKNCPPWTCFLRVFVSVSPLLRQGTSAIIKPRFSLQPVFG